MSGLLVKSTLIMRDNLVALNELGLSEYPVILGGAALTRTYVERDLRAVYEGRLFYGKDAFEGLHVMDRLGAVRNGTEPDDPAWGREPGGRDLPARARRAPGRPGADPGPCAGRRGRRPRAVAAVLGLPGRARRVDRRHRRLPQRDRPLPQPVGLPTHRAESPTRAFRERVRAVLRAQLDAARTSGVLLPQVVYGYLPVNADGSSLIVWSDASRSSERARLVFPRQQVDPWMCIADFFRPVSSPEVDVAAFHIVTMGARVTEAAAELKAADRYTDYLFLHGLGVEMTEALAELWHARIRAELGIAGSDGALVDVLRRQAYQGGRYSWGYPACPDLEDNLTVATLLDASRIGVEVGADTGYQFHPEQTTSAIICHHPQAKYFVA